MENTKKSKVIKELFIYDFLIGTCFWSLIILILLPFFKLPQSLASVLYIFFATVSLIFLPFSLFKIRNALYLAKRGVEIMAANISIEHACFGGKIKFEYEYDGHKYHKVKYFPSIFFPQKGPMKLLIDTMDPSNFIILELKKKSVISIIRERNS